MLKDTNFDYIVKLRNKLSGMVQTIEAQNPDIRLEQNRHHSFSQTTIINYHIPASTADTIELIIASADAGTIFRRYNVEKGMLSHYSDVHYFRVLHCKGLTILRLIYIYLLFLTN